MRSHKTRPGHFKFRWQKFDYVKLRKALNEILMNNICIEIIEVAFYLLLLINTDWVWKIGGIGSLVLEQGAVSSIYISRFLRRQKVCSSKAVLVTLLQAPHH